MKRMPVLLLFAALAWPGSDKTLLLAQETPRSPITQSSEETTINPGDLPTPQLMQVEVDLGAGGPNVRMRIHPAWQGLYRPSVRVGRARTEPQAEPQAEEAAAPPPGGAEELQQVLENALDRASPRATPAP
jgi:hypothetical protein